MHLTAGIQDLVNMHETYLKEVRALRQQHMDTSSSSEDAQLKAVVAGLKKIAPFLKMYKPICLDYSRRVEMFEDSKVIQRSFSSFLHLPHTAH